MNSPTSQYIENIWNETVRETFDAYMKIPNVSPAFDSHWQQNGHIDKVAQLFLHWAKENAPKNATVFLQDIENKTPLIVIDIPKNNYEANDTVLLYGHLDKQPMMTGWDEGIEPFDATYIGNRVYGRGGADDGYAIFASLMAVNRSDEKEVPRARCVIVIEASEESGSPDLVEHLELLNKNEQHKLGDVSLVVCLDSGCLTYDHLWVTRSLRGLVQVNLTVKVLEQGVHSGAAGGIVPSATHILRTMLDRVADSPSGEVKIGELNVEIRPEVLDAAKQVATILLTHEAHGLAFAKDVEPVYTEVAEQIIANTYKPQLEIIGIDGVPAIADAGNVLLPEITYALSFRIPPGVDPNLAAAKISEAFLKDVPYNAQVSVTIDSLASGWEAPVLESWLEATLQNASEEHFGNPAHFMGEGGTIPFMAMLGEKYPKSQFVVTGLLGPQSNAHGPNEFLDLPTAFKITACIADVLGAHAQRK